MCPRWVCGCTCFIRKFHDCPAISILAAQRDIRYVITLGCSRYPQLCDCVRTACTHRLDREGAAGGHAEVVAGVFRGGSGKRDCRPLRVLGWIYRAVQFFIRGWYYVF